MVTIFIHKSGRGPCYTGRSLCEPQNPNQLTLRLTATINYLCCKRCASHNPFMHQGSQGSDGQGRSSNQSIMSHDRFHGNNYDWIHRVSEGRFTQKLVPLCKRKPKIVKGLKDLQRIHIRNALTVMLLKLIFCTGLGLQCTYTQLHLKLIFWF